MLTMSGVDDTLASQEVRELLAGPPYAARRQLWREGMSEHGADVEWLINPSLIPSRAVHTNGEVRSDAFQRLAAWCLEELVYWMDDVHGKLDYDKVFKHHKLSGPQADATRFIFEGSTMSSLVPGLGTVAELHQVVALVAQRDGIDRGKWPEIAERAKNLGIAIAKDGTVAQALIRCFQSGAQHMASVDA